MTAIPSRDRVAAWVLYNLLRDRNIGAKHTHRRACYQGPLNEVPNDHVDRVVSDLLDGGWLVAHKGGEHLAVDPSYLSDHAGNLLEALDDDRARVLRHRLPDEHLPDAPLEEDLEEDPPLEAEDPDLPTREDLHDALEALRSRVDHLEDRLHDVEDTQPDHARRLSKLEGRRVRELEESVADLRSTVETLVDALREALDP